MKRRNRFRDEGNFEVYFVSNLVILRFLGYPPISVVNLAYFSKHVSSIYYYLRLGGLYTATIYFS